nr:MAG TPA: hypothetical protein [Caudoviricetes sp.]
MIRILLFIIGLGFFLKFGIWILLLIIIYIIYLACRARH